MNTCTICLSGVLPEYFIRCAGQCDVGLCLRCASKCSAQIQDWVCVSCCCDTSDIVQDNPTRKGNKTKTKGVRHNTHYNLFYTLSSSLRLPRRPPR